MAVFRVHKTSDYTVLSNYHFRDKSISLKAKGLLSLMLSLPPNWSFSIRGLASLSSDGVSATEAALKELEKHAYLKRTQMMEGGRFAGYAYDIYEQPCAIFKNGDTTLSYTENPYTENPYTEKQDTEKQYTENNIQLNTKEIKNKKNKICVDEIRINNTDIEWIIQLWNSCEDVTPIRKIQNGTIRYQETCILLQHYTKEDIMKAYQQIQESQYLKERKPTFDWFINHERNIIDKLLEGAYQDWKEIPKAKNGRFTNNHNSYIDYDELEKILYNR